MLTYDTPGKYTLKPSDYHYSPEIIVELCGAGGGGTNNGINSGGGGSYVKAKIQTNQRTFTLNIGKGGVSNKNISYDMYSNFGGSKGSEGGDTSIMSDDKYTKLIAGGGQAINLSSKNYTANPSYNSYFDNCGCPSSDMEMLDVSEIIMERGRSGTPNIIQQKLYTDPYYMFPGRGGDSARGGKGGENPYDSSLKQERFGAPINIFPESNNGTFPGGGGSTNFAYQYQTTTNAWISSPRNEAGNGANGQIIIYITHKITIDKTPISENTQQNTLSLKLFDGKVRYNIDVINMKHLFNKAYTFFGKKYGKIRLTYRGVILNEENELTSYNMSDGDIILISEEKSDMEHSPKSPNISIKETPNNNINVPSISINAPTNISFNIGQNNPQPSEYNYLPSFLTSRFNGYFNGKQNNNVQTPQQPPLHQNKPKQYTKMKSITLKNENYEFPIMVSSMEKLFEITPILFEFEYRKFSLTYKGLILDKSKPLRYYDISDGDIIIVCETPDNYIRKKVENRPYLLATIDIYDMIVLVDTGAQCSAITMKTVEALGLTSKINYKNKGKYHGIGGTVNKIGTIENMTIKLNHKLITIITLGVIENYNEHEIIIGSDMFAKYNCKINIENKKLEWNGQILEFLNDTDIERYEEPVLNEKEADIYTNTL